MVEQCFKLFKRDREETCVLNNVFAHKHNKPRLLWCPFVKYLLILKDCIFCVNIYTVIDSKVVISWINTCFFADILERFRLSTYVEVGSLLQLCSIKNIQDLVAFEQISTQIVRMSLVILHDYIIFDHKTFAYVGIILTIKPRKQFISALVSVRYRMCNTSWCRTDDGCISNNHIGPMSSCLAFPYRSVSQ